MNDFLKQFILVGLITLVLTFLVSCASEQPRTDITLEMSEEDSVEAIVQQELMTAGSTLINMEQNSGKPEKSTVTYVDEVEMEKPVLVENVIEETINEAKTQDFDESEFETGRVVIDEPVVDVSIDDPIVANVDNSNPILEEPIDPSNIEVVTEDVINNEPSDYELNASKYNNFGKKDPADFSTPKSTTKYPTYNVKIGDTLWSISHDFDCTISELCAANNITRRDILRVGQAIIIPKKADPSSLDKSASTYDTKTTYAKPETKKVTVPSGETEFYTVKAGDSYWKISRKYDISVSELMALNDTSNDFLREGQRILVPKK